jgi:hypothetical protein
VATLDQAFLTLGVGTVMNPEMRMAAQNHLDLTANALEPWDSGVKCANFIDVRTDMRTCYSPETFNP